MTKINKLGKSTFVIAILSFLLVAVLAFGGTYAYFSAQSDTVSGSVTTGHLRITSIKDGTGTTSLTSTTQIAQPNEIIYKDKTINTVVNANISYYTRVRFSVVVTPKSGAAHAVTTSDCGDKVTQNIEILKVTVENSGETGGTKDKWETGAAATDLAVGEVIYYQLAPTIVADNQAAKDLEPETFTFTIQVRDWVGHNGLADGTNTGAGGAVDNDKIDLADGCDYWMDATVEVRVTVEVLQADYLNDATGLVVATTGFENGADAETAWNTALATSKTNSVTDGTRS